MVSVIDISAHETKQNVKRRRTREDWQALVEAWESANQTQKAFCQERGLCYRLFNHWKSRFKVERLSSPDIGETQFVPVQLKSPVSTTSSVQVHFPNGIRIEIASEQDLPVLLGSAKALLAL